MCTIASASMFAPLRVLHAAPIVAADSNPQRLVRLVAPFAPGGGAGIHARLDPIRSARQPDEVIVCTEQFVA